MANTEYYEIVDAVWSLFSGIANDGTPGVVHLSTLDYTVFDGIPVGEDYPANAVFVGWDADPEGNFQSASVDQVWAGPIGNLRRDETIDVVCALVALYGDADRWKPVRDAALLIQTDVETKLRAAPDLHLGVNGVRQYIVSEFKPIATFAEPYSESGYWFRLTFTVSVKTRI
jgi:hypothetical protein